MFWKKDAVAVPAPAEHERAFCCCQKKELNIIDGLNHAEEIRGGLPLFLVPIKH